ncbi:hypothetical protein PSA7680_03041 [Pseudoruegeria aquimaris]|uniref:NfeD-like C-terminal domain-containing protein n=2 Tax=Pseudoruegeria aquimaris TaxID=393663 RepID=A0A1Y5T8K4_9RHOB|nr:hypothetical protein [Pseudoruegeria aquimaris]SLN57833.1 hypothetical protein PSA7680_03041 [Pseudoruegeria aquimaris]
MWETWWLWMAAGLVLAILEVLAPGFILLGFAIGAALVGLVFLLPGAASAAMAASLPLTLVVFALLSGLAWWLLRRIFGAGHGQVKIWERDINED